MPTMTYDLWAWGQNQATTSIGWSPLGNKTSPVEIIKDITDFSTYNSTNSIVRTSSGKLYSWGYNNYGQIGNGTIASQYFPWAIGTDSDWSSNFKVGTEGSYAIKNDGTLWVWGRNSVGELGLGHNSPVLVPTQVGTDSDWVKCYMNHNYGNTYALKANGTLWACGYGWYGGLGNGGTANTNIFVQVPGIWQDAISLGYYNIIALKSDGTLWGWGRQDYSEFGMNSLVKQLSPVRIGATTIWNSYKAGSGVLAIKNDGTLWGWGGNGGALGLGNTSLTTVPTQVGSSSNWTDIISLGHTVVKDSNNDIWVCGINTDGALGVGHASTPVTSLVNIGSGANWVKMHIGSNRCVVLKSDGTIWSSGSNIHGQVGNGTKINVSVLTQAGSDSNWTDLICGHSHTYAIKPDKSLWSWGQNYYGELGIGSTTDKTVPTIVPGEYNWRALPSNTLPKIMPLLGSSNSFALRTPPDPIFWTNFSGQTETAAW